MQEPEAGMLQPSPGPSPLASPRAAPTTPTAGSCHVLGANEPGAGGNPQAPSSGAADAGFNKGDGFRSGMAVARLAGRVAGLESQLSAARAEHAEAVAQVEAGKKVASELEAELAQTRTSMRAAAAAHQEEVRALKAQVVVANSAKEEAGRQLAQTQGELEALAGSREQSARDARGELASLRKALAAAESAKAEVAALSSQQGILIEALESELSSLKSQVENVRLSLNKQQAAVSMHSSWVQSQLGSHGQLVETLESRSAALATAVKEREASQEAVQKLETVAAGLRVELCAARSEAARLRAQMPAKEEALSKALEENHGLVDLLAKSEACLGAARAALTDQASLLQDLTSRAAAAHAKYNEEIATARAALAAAEEEAVACRDLVKSYKDRAGEASEAIDDANLRATAAENRAAAAEDRALQLQADWQDRLSRVQADYGALQSKHDLVLKHLDQVRAKHAALKEEQNKQAHGDAAAALTAAATAQASAAVTKTVTATTAATPAAVAELTAPTMPGPASAAPTPAPASAVAADEDRSHSLPTEQRCDAEDGRAAKRARTDENTLRQVPGRVGLVCQITPAQTPTDCGPSVSEAADVTTEQERGQDSRDSIERKGDAAVHNTAVPEQTSATMPQAAAAVVAQSAAVAPAVTVSGPLISRGHPVDMSAQPAANTAVSKQPHLAAVQAEPMDPLEAAKARLSGESTGSKGRAMAAASVAIAAAPAAATFPVHASAAPAPAVGPPAHTAPQMLLHVSDGLSENGRPSGAAMLMAGRLFGGRIGSVDSGSSSGFSGFGSDADATQRPVPNMQHAASVRIADATQTAHVGVTGAAAFNHRALGMKPVGAGTGQGWGGQSAMATSAAGVLKEPATHPQSAASGQAQAANQFSASAMAMPPPPMPVIIPTALTFAAPPGSGAADSVGSEPRRQPDCPSGGGRRKLVVPVMFGGAGKASGGRVSGGRPSGSLAPTAGTSREPAVQAPADTTAAPKIGRPLRSKAPTSTQMGGALGGIFAALAGDESSSEDEE